eukprot:scaffold156537_cov21-Tisochrysis_lutea.AAC.1
MHKGTNRVKGTGKGIDHVQRDWQCAKGWVMHKGTDRVKRIDHAQISVICLKDGGAVDSIPFQCPCTEAHIVLLFFWYQDMFMRKVRQSTFNSQHGIKNKGIQRGRAGTKHVCVLQGAGFLFFAERKAAGIHVFKCASECFCK